MDISSSIAGSVSYREAMSQYHALRKTFGCAMENRDAVSRVFNSREWGAVIFSGSGSSFEISRSSALSASMRLKTRALALAAGDIMLNHKNYSNVLKGALLVLVSRSGSTSEALLAAKCVREYGGGVVSIVCQKDSELAKLSDFTLEIPWAFDDSVCQTRTVSNLYAANLCLVSLFSGDDALLQDVDKAIAMGGDYIKKWEKPIQEAARGGWSNAVVLADGELEGIAQEGALAFKEICDAQSNYYHVLDVRHGPMLGITEKTLVIAALSPNDDSYQRELIKDVVKRGATVIVYTPEELAPIEGAALHVNSGAPFGAAASGLPFIFVPQMAALTHAAVNGINPDKPEALDPWIKL